MVFNLCRFKLYTPSKVLISPFLFENFNHIKFNLLIFTFILMIVERQGGKQDSNISTGLAENKSNSTASIRSKFISLFPGLFSQLSFLK